VLIAVGQASGRTDEDDMLRSSFLTLLVRSYKYVRRRWFPWVCEKQLGSTK
jgi:hypothetical protein